MPALPRNCYKTPHGYLFRIVVPESLRPIIGKREIKRSLGKDYHAALRLARTLAGEVEQEFTEARERLEQRRTSEDALEHFMATPLAQREQRITEVTPELVAGLRSLWLATLEEDLTWRRAGLEDEDYDDLQANIEDMQAMIATALARGQPKPFKRVLHTLLAGRGYTLDVSEETENQLVLDLLPALQAGYDVLAQRQQGRLVSPQPSQAPPLPAAWEPKTPQSGPGGQEMTWEALFEYWLALRPRKPGTVRDIQRALADLQTLYPDKGPKDLVKSDVTRWFQYLRETRGNKPKTLEKKGPLIGTLYSLAVHDELLQNNPFAGYKYANLESKSGEDDPEARQPFSQAQLTQLFSADGLYGVSTKGGGGYHARVWVALLAVFSGGRIGELCGLQTANVYRSPVPYYKITKGKNSNSIRDVPLHPILVDLGFLDYVAAVEADGHASLWPKLRTRSQKKNLGDVMSKWFNPYIHRRLGFPSEVVFHSFRHTFKDLCRNALIPYELHQALTGHGKQTVGDQYGIGFSIEVKHQEMSRIEPPVALPRPLPYDQTPPKVKQTRAKRARRQSDGRT